MCKPTYVSAANNFEDLLFGDVQTQKDTVVVKTPAPAKTQKTAAPSKKEKKDKKSTKAKVQVNGDKVIAERFRTKQCKSYLEKGSCPYESRCMFAHGEHELRTAQANLHDGLVSEEAIRQFKKMMTLKLRARQAELRHQRAQQAATPPVVVQPRFESPRDGSESPVGSASFGPSETSSCSGDDCSRTYIGDSYCHNPYGWQALESPLEVQVAAFPTA